ncbi:MAG: replication-associated recombination protein A [Bdellovibrionales bacterium]|nr:replication-associated recombination protein A [Bdellovibrionales bacterium]
MSDNLNLFSTVSKPKSVRVDAPLAEVLRPAKWEEFEGLNEIDAKLLEKLKLGRGRPPSMILWGPPGSGKTTLAKLIGKSFDLCFREFSAVLSGVKDIRLIVELARKDPKATLLFVDEIHRFNKSQQDAFLPHVENGTIILIGATTENPSFYVNAALLSRARVLCLPSLSNESLLDILLRAEKVQKVNCTKEARELLVASVGGDARRLINRFELIADEVLSSKKEKVTKEDIAAYLKNEVNLKYDKAGDEHYNLVSAFIKSMRGSDPDAALYWAFRMLESGEDPRFLFRRMIIFASEDIGNADPRALQIAISGADAFDRLGLPEGKIPLAQVITYLACALKSNRSYLAMKHVEQVVKDYPNLPVPIKLRNAPTELMKDIGYGEDYKYPHDFEYAHVAEEAYLPKEIAEKSFYNASDNGYEKSIKDRLLWFKHRKLE